MSCWSCVCMVSLTSSCSTPSRRSRSQSPPAVTGLAEIEQRRHFERDLEQKLGLDLRHGASSLRISEGFINAKSTQRKPRASPLRPAGNDRTVNASRLRAASTRSIQGSRSSMPVLMLMWAMLVRCTGVFEGSVLVGTEAGQSLHKSHQIPKLALGVGAPECGHPGGDDAVLQDPKELWRCPPVSHFGKFGRLRSKPLPHFAGLLSRSAVTLHAHFIEQAKSLSHMILRLKDRRRHRPTGMGFTGIRHSGAEDPFYHPGVILIRGDVVRAAVDQRGTPDDAQ